MSLKPVYGLNMTEMFNAAEQGKLHAIYAIGENPAQAEADQHRTEHILQGLDHLVVQDIFLTATARLAHVVLPASSSWCEAEGTVTNSERRVQRVRKALEPPGNARDDLWIISELARRLGHDWGHPSAEDVWNEVRRMAPIFAGMSYQRLEREGGLHWPCFNESHPGELFLHSRLWHDPHRRTFGAVLGRRARSAGRATGRGVPLHAHDRPPARLVQHRSADRRLYLAAQARGDTRHLAGGCPASGHPRRRSGARHVPARQRGGAGSTRSLAPVRPRLHDLSLPGRGAGSTSSPSTRPIPSRERPSSRPAPFGWIRSGPRSRSRQPPARPSGTEARWICTCSTRSPRPRSARRSTPSSASLVPGGKAARGTRAGMPLPRRVATRRGPSATSCFPRSRRCRRGSAG